MATARSGEWTIEDRCESAWHYLPLEVPPGTAALRVELDYDSSSAVLDLGCFGPAGFRGWSGGARQGFVIAAESATPGYLPGPLEAGTWQVVIGLHRIPAAGVPYRLVAETSDRQGPLAPGIGDEPVTPAAARPPPRALPSGHGLPLLAADLHSPTLHSDGVLTVPELARLAAERGLDYLAFTDHNTISHHAELPAASPAHAAVLLPGQE